VIDMSVATVQPGPWSVDSVLALADDGSHSRHELIDGTLIVAPAPSYPHQRAARRLAAILEKAAREGGHAVEIFEAVNIEIAAGLLIPDIAVVRAESARTAEAALPASAMLAVIEIVSPSTKRIDRLVKPGLYAEAGIATFWRVELEPTPTVTVFSLREDGQYAQVGAAHGTHPLLLPVPFPVTLNPADLTSV
jgi:Uma2 family endonuclease